MIPEALRARRQWLTWRYEERDGKVTKPPNGSSTDPDTWTTYAEARGLVEAGHAAGVGFVFTAEDPFVGIDLDRCIVDGQLLPAAAAIVRALDTYAEVSVSGTGVHLILGGRLDRARKVESPWWPGAIEVYAEARYFTVTGDRLDGTPATVRPRQRALGEPAGPAAGPGHLRR